MRVGIGLGLGPDAEKAATQAVRQAKKGVPRPDLALAFGSIQRDQKKIHAALCREIDPRILLGGSSYAEITPAGVTKASVAVLLLSFEGGRARFAGAPLNGDPSGAGRAIADALAGLQPGALPVGLFFSSISNGEEGEGLRAVNEGLGRLPLFGGLCCGEYDLGMGHPRFWDNYQYSGSKLTRHAARMALLELPRQDYRMGFGFEHGWKPIGPLITLSRCKRNVVYEIDGRPVLEYYRQFIGREASNEFFQHMIQRYGFSLEVEGSERSLLKLPVTVDFKKGCITYLPSEDLQGRRVQLILASRKGLVEGARQAAERCRASLDGFDPKLVLVVSCCTRSAILHSKMDTEVDAIREVFGKRVPVFGFYSGGEIVPYRSRYEEVVDPAHPFSGSAYHTTTVGMLAIGSRRPSRATVPPRARATRGGAEAARLRGLLARSEQVLDSTEGFLANFSRKSVRDGERLKKQAEVIHRYTPHDVWKRIGANVDRGVYELSDAEFNGAFLFMDVKGFTSYSEEHSSGEVVAVLNELFDPATRLIYACDGDVDKFIGDCIFAAFSRPQDAVRAAARILKLFGTLQAEGNPFSARIGINAGRAVRANVGSAARREYTYIGDAVNLAQRLESNCAPGKALVCAALEPAARRLFPALKRREVALKGKKQPVIAYECSF